MDLQRKPPKPEKGFAIYESADIQRIRLIKQTQELGFSLKEVHKLLTLEKNECSEIKVLVLEKMIKIKSLMDGLVRSEKSLELLLNYTRSV